MQGVPIKFRGKDVDTDKYVCGDLIHGEDGICIIINDDRHMVDENSIVQLVGYDVNGEEVYEGDEILLANNIDTQSTVCCNVITAKLYVNVNLRCFRLKKVI